ncbi:hypothetical protein LMTR13_26170 [Bradyrhizobium icense]|uniref:Uncharacterized protein n=1 Tax=Bradyrhizobium icense TaxID=1274631 RepID=A0A1B1UJY9_9BRAD|nr:hypothetical protein LMTR13_26170 [Bradyrhizobium icense]
MVFQQPWNLAGNPLATVAHPHKAAIAVLVQILSLKTKRSGSKAILIFDSLSSPSGEVRTVAFASHHGFFEAELLAVDELPLNGNQPSARYQRARRPSRAR